MAQEQRLHRCPRMARSEVCPGFRCRRWVLAAVHHQSPTSMSSGAAGLRHAATFALMVLSMALAWTARRAAKRADHRILLAKAGEALAHLKPTSRVVRLLMTRSMRDFCIFLLAFPLSSLVHSCLQNSSSEMCTVIADGALRLHKGLRGMLPWQEQDSSDAPELLNSPGPTLFASEPEYVSAKVSHS
mmetsp:Transcript_21659/g.50252  ORF Transcript_21659/g.50252 Transcript_21659/m.50252 type:complete len:187 (+) Transcript_21659:54-614(+)